MTHEISHAESGLLKALIAAVLSTAATAATASTGEADMLDLSLKELMQQPVELVYGASRYEQKVTQAPSSVTIVTAEDIRRYGHRTLAEVLRSVRGLYVPDDRNYTYLGIRGFHRPGDYNSRVLVTIDGHRINDNLYDSGTLTREGMIDVELIERVEVIRGPSSSIYGSSAFFGVINVITKSGRQIDGVEVLADAGTHDSYRGGITYGGKLDNGAQWLVSASQYSSDGASSLYFPELDQRVSDEPRAANDGIARALDWEDAQQLYTNLRHGGFSVSGFYSGRTKQIPTASFGTIFNDGREKTVDYRSYIDVSYGGEVSDKLNLHVRGFYDDYGYKGWYPYDYDQTGDPTDAVMMKDGSIGRWVGAEWQLTAGTAAGHRFILGGEYREHLREYQWSYDDIEPRYYYIDTDESSRMLGVFAQSETVLRRDLLLTAGLRFDRYSEDLGSTVNPRLGLIYSPSQTGTLKMLFGEAFRAPNPYERYYYSEQANRPTLRPEKIQTYEIAYEQYLGQRYRLNVSTYYYHIEDLITQRATEDEAYYYDNQDHLEAAGIELEFEGRFESGAQLRASYALQRTEDERRGGELSSSPMHIAKLNMSAPLFTPKLLAGVELQYQGSSDTVNGGKADGFTLINFTLVSRDILNGLDLSGSIYNLFDERYGYSGAEDHVQNVIEQDGRTFRLKAIYKF